MRRFSPSLGFALASLLAPIAARANDWSLAMAGAHEQWFSPDSGGHGFVIVDLRGRDVVGGGDLHLNLNTETLTVSVERLRVGTDRLEFSAAVRAEGAYAGVLPDWFQGGRTRSERGFYASYAQAITSLKWLPGGPHSVELVVGGRRWLFARISDVTSPDLTLPPDTWVFEPRVRYTFWNITSPGDEWSPHIVYPRVTGIAAGVELGADLRADTRAWGGVRNVDDGRNRPGAVIFMARQWLRAGVRLGARVRLQVEESASWGEGEDDLTRVRVGGMTPYVVPVPGLPWPALLCERLVSAQVGVHVRPSLRSEHEFGVALGGGLFNDLRRTGALDVFSAAGGVAAFVDLRFGRVTAHVRGGYGFPVAGFEQPALSALAALGVRAF